MAPITLENKMDKLNDELKQITNLYGTILKESSIMEQKIDKQANIINSLLKMVKGMTHEQAYDILDTVDADDFEKMYIILSQKVYGLEEPENIYQILANNHLIMVPKIWLPVNSFVEKYNLNNQNKYWLRLIDAIKIHPYCHNTIINQIKTMLEYIDHLSFDSRKAYGVRRIFSIIENNIWLLGHKKFFDVVCKKLDEFSLDQLGKEIYEDYKWMKNFQ